MKVSVEHFINNDLHEFSNSDNVRSIPSVIDGLKDSQRKALYGMIQHGQSEVKVALLGGFCSQKTHYEHGETSMSDTIVGMAQDFPGSNNINLFEPIGQFGTILSSEASAHRYIFTKPSDNMRKIVRKEDDPILEYKSVDGDKVEPRYFLPTLPLWLVNGTLGIGTGHSSKILARDPKSVIKVIKMLIKNSEQGFTDKIKQLLVPSFTGWKGSVTAVDGEEFGAWQLTGNLEIVNTTTIRITELPVGYGVDKFKKILIDLLDKGKIKDYENNSTEQGFDFEIKVTRDTTKKGEEALIKMFKLVTRHTENVTLWDSEGRLRRFDNVFEALKDFVQYRSACYDTRKQHLIDDLSEQVLFLKNKMVFINEWHKLHKKDVAGSDAVVDHMLAKGVEERYLDRLMSMKIQSLTLDAIQGLEKEVGEKEAEYNTVVSTHSTDMYLSDLGLI